VEADEVVITKEEQQPKQLLLSKSSGSKRRAHQAKRAQSAALLKETLVTMHKQPRDAVRQYLTKVCFAVLCSLQFDIHIYGMVMYWSHPFMCCFVEAVSLQCLGLQELCFDLHVHLTGKEP